MFSAVKQKPKVNYYCVGKCAILQEWCWGMMHCNCANNITICIFKSDMLWFWRRLSHYGGDVSGFSLRHWFVYIFYLYCSIVIAARVLNIFSPITLYPSPQATKNVFRHALVVDFVLLTWRETLLCKLFCLSTYSKVIRILYQKTSACKLLGSLK